MTAHSFRIPSSETGFRKADPSQEAAICHAKGPCAVIAGPGSGKTFVLVRRIRRLIDVLGVSPDTILVLTFSRNAAQQMRARFLAQQSRENEQPGKNDPAQEPSSYADYSQVVFGTFHAVFYRMLQESSQGKCRLTDPVTKYNYLRHLCDARKEIGNTTPEELQLLISRYKNGLPASERWLPSLTAEYDRYLESRGLLDFDDMVLRCRSMLQEDPEILKKWRTRFSWILVDEFQDVSRSQYEVLALLSAPGHNLFVVGDDDQSIYGFRGADPSTMRRFLSDYRSDGLKVIYLTKNYRCAHSVLRAGAALIRENRNRLQKEFRSGTSEKGAFFCRPFTSRDEQYDFLAEEILRLKPSSRQGAAVIFRTHAGTKAFLSVLERRHVPYSAEKSMHRAAALPGEAQILEDLIAYYRSAVRIRSGGAYQRDLLRIMNRPERYLSGSFVPRDRMDAPELLKNAGYEQDTIREMLDDLSLLKTLSPAYSLRYLLDSIGYRKYVVQVFPHTDGFLDRLLSEAGIQAHASGWLSRLESLLQEYSVRDKSHPGDKSEEGTSGSLNRSKEEQAVPETDRSGHSADRTGAFPVRILTMHACKGLEFDHVWIPDLNEGNIPSRRAWSGEQIEEERRLFYVAMTRARFTLTVTYLEGTPDRPASPSRFLHPFMDHK